MEINDVFIDCVDEWAKEGLDERLNIAIDRFGEWIKDFDSIEKNLLITLLQKFNYYSNERIVNIIKKLAEEASIKYGVSNDNSVVSIVRKKNGMINSSFEYCMIHRSVSGLSKAIYIDSVSEIADGAWGKIKNVVYVDDCCGTGRQFTNFLKGQRKSFADKQIILLVVEAVDNAIEYIKNETKKLGLNVEVIAFSRKEKALQSMLEEEITVFYEMCKKQKIDFVKGFEDAEALMAFYNNTPNDTLGIFWYDSEKNLSIFPREEYEVPKWKLNDAKKKRRREQYEAKC